MFGLVGNDKNECRYSCEVTTPFEPKGCLYTMVSQQWEEIKHLTSNLCSCDKCFEQRIIDKNK